MNKTELNTFAQKDITPGFIKALLNDDLSYELLCTYIDINSPLVGIIHDDEEKSEFDPVEKLSEDIYVEGAEIIEIKESDDTGAMIYKDGTLTVVFIIKHHWTIAFWNK